jgi:hypothetical protein
MKNKLFGTTIGLLALMMIFPAGQLFADATLRVGHGIPGKDVSDALDPALPVDVCVGSTPIITGFTFGTIAGPFSLPAGTYPVDISLANTLAPCSNDPVLSKNFTLNDGDNVTIMAHLEEGGGLTATAFDNALAMAPEAGSAKIVAHHLANAPAVNFSVQKFIRTLLTVPGVENGMQAAADLEAGLLNINISPSGSNLPIIFQRKVNFTAGLTYIAYAVGSLENGTFTIMVEPIGGLAGTTILPPSVG